MTEFDGGPLLTPACSVTVVIVTWNSAATISDCLDSLMKSPPGVNWQAIVIDNGSSDETVSVVGRYVPRAPVTLIANPHNLGLAAANNQGIAAADAEVVVISNPDVIYHREALANLVRCLVRHPSAALAVARLEHPDGSLQVCAGDLPSLRESLLGKRLGASLGSPPSATATSGTWWDSWAHDEERRIGRGQEACYAVRRTAINAVGPQDAKYTLDWEGFDWARRMRRGGWDIWFCPDAHVTHIGGVSLRQARYRWVLSTHQGMWRYHAAGLAAWQRPFLAAVCLVRAVLKCVAVTVRDSLYGAAHR